MDSHNFMKCVVFVLVRTASTRLPEKALLTINKTPLIKILIDKMMLKILNYDGHVLNYSKKNYPREKW